MQSTPPPNATVYVPVWQTWSLLRQKSTTTPSVETSHATGATVVSRTQEIRERMQIARIQNRLTVHELATRIRCDVETLASFERGDDVISDEVHRRMCKELNL